MIEQLKAYESFDPEKMHEQLYLSGVYCFFEPKLMSIVTETDWIYEGCGHNFAYLKDNIACKKSEELLLEYFLKVFDVKLRKTHIFSGIDKISDQWHDDAEEKIFIQTLCYQEDLNEEDGGCIRLRCLDDAERYFYPKNGHVLVINHHLNVEHKVDLITSDKKRIVVNSIFDI
jgi:hypothetical protein